MYKTGTGVDGHSLHRHGVSDIWYKINHMSAFLLFFNFALKELHAHTVCFSLPPFLSLSLSAVSLSLIIGETISLSSPQVCVCFNKTMFPLWYYVHDCDTLWHKSFIMTHSLVYRLGYHEEMVSITLDNHKAIILLLLWYQCMNPHTVNQTWISFSRDLPIFEGFPVAQLVKNLPTMRETPVQSLVEDDPWRRKRLPTAIFLPECIPWTGEPGGYSPRGHKELDTTEQLAVSLLLLMSTVSSRYKIYVYCIIEEGIDAGTERLMIHFVNRRCKL